MIARVDFPALFVSICIVLKIKYMFKKPTQSPTLDHDEIKSSHCGACKTAWILDIVLRDAQSSHRWSSEPSAGSQQGPHTMWNMANTEHWRCFVSRGSVTAELPLSRGPSVLYYVAGCNKSSRALVLSTGKHLLVYFICYINPNIYFKPLHFNILIDRFHKYTSYIILKLTRD